MDNNKFEVNAKPEAGNFVSLLVAGKIHDALVLRADELEDVSNGFSNSVESAKVVSGMAVVIGLSIGGPLSIYAAGLAGVVYCYAVLTDFQTTKTLSPSPIIRTSGKMFVAGVAERIKRTASYLIPKDSKEYQLITQNVEQVASWLATIPPEQRETAYKTMLRGELSPNSQGDAQVTPRDAKSEG